MDPADRDALERLWGEAGAWLAETWLELNDQCFAGGLPYAGLVWGWVPDRAGMAHTNQRTGRVTLHPALLYPPRPRMFGLPSTLLGVAYARDVLLHELVHVATRAEHNTTRWCREVSRISPLVGLPAMTAAPQRGRTSAPGTLLASQVATWPYTLRTVEHYQADNRKVYVPT